MAEELVLARLSVDSEGVIQGIDEGSKAMKTGEVQLGKLGKSQLVVEKSSTSLVGAIFKLVVGISAVIKIMAFFNITLNTTKTVLKVTTIRVAGLGGAFAGLGTIIAGVTVAMVAFAAAVFLVVAAVGAITALLAGLTLQIIKNTDWWKRGAEAVGDWHARLVAGEEALGRMGRRLAGFASGEAGAALLELKKLTEQTDEFTRALKGGELKFGTGQDVLGIGFYLEAFSIALHGVDESWEATEAALRLGLQETAEDTEKVIRALLKMGFTIEQLREATGKPLVDPGPLATPFLPQKETFGLTATPAGPATTDPFGFAGLLSPQEMADMASAAQNAIATIQQAARDGIISWDDYAFGVGRVQEKLLEAGFTIEEVGGIFATVGAELESVVPDPSAWDLWKDSLVDAMDTAKLKVELVTAAMNAFTNAMVQGFTNGGVSFKKIIGEMLMALVPILLAFGATGLVEGMLGINPGGFQAAAIAFAAAGAAALAARALGAGGGVATSAGGGGRGGGGGGRRQVNQEVNLYINGSLITDPAEFARWVAKILREADLDGAV